MQVDWILKELFSRWPSPRDLGQANQIELEQLLQPLGLWKRRASILKAFGTAFASGHWMDLTDLPGVGKYAKDSWDIFVLGRLDVNPTDKKLLDYLVRRKHGY